MGEKRSKTGIISVEKPTWFPLKDETGELPVYDTAMTMGTAVSIKPTANYKTCQRWCVALWRRYCPRWGFCISA